MKKCISTKILIIFSFRFINRNNTLYQLTVSSESRKKYNVKKGINMNCL